MTQVRENVFFSYSHKDKKWLEKLQTILSPLVRKNILKTRADTQILPGAIWRDEIKNAINFAKVAVLLVSPSFLASDFIVKHELPPILEAAEKRELIILWIAVSPSLYKVTEIADYQSVNDPSHPLDTLPTAMLKKELVRICEKIVQVVNTRQPPSNTPAPGIQQTQLSSQLSRMPSQASSSASSSPIQTQATNSPSLYILGSKQDMIDPASQTNIAEIAAFILKRKRIGSTTLLFLGSRTSGLYGNSALYATVKNYSPPHVNFDALSDVEKFRVCHKVLEQRFNESEINTILHASLADYSPYLYREEDIWTVELMQKGYFDTVLLTSIDSLVENALLFKGITIPFNFRLVMQGRESIDEIIQYEKQSSKVIKLFGDLKIGRYNTVGRQLELDDNRNRELKNYLHQILRESILVIGYDPLWDRPIERAFLEQGKDITYVNEEAPAKDLHIDRVIRKRKGKLLVGEQGGYKLFMKELYESLP